MTDYKYLGLVTAVLAVISTWNFVAWTSVDPVVIELKPEDSRMPASIENDISYEKPILSETINVDCGQEMSLQTPHSQVRFVFTNCKKAPVVKNHSNHFQASIWKSLENWKSDYIPLEDSKNQITYRHPSSKEDFTITIERLNALDDAK